MVQNTVHQPYFSIQFLNHEVCPGDVLGMSSRMYLVACSFMQIFALLSVATNFFCQASYAGRSPGLNVCDYTLWHEINRRMRKTEARWPKDRLETRVQYLARLRRTAMRLPPSFIDRSIGDLRWRCARLYDARGGHFEEGGR